MAIRMQFGWLDNPGTPRQPPCRVEWPPLLPEVKMVKTGKINMERTEQDVRFAALRCTRLNLYLEEPT
jgi:hypothetical protein